MTAPPLPTGRTSRPATRPVGLVLAALAVLLAAVAGVAHLATAPAARVDLLRTPELSVGPVAAVVGGLLLASPAARRVAALLLAVGLTTTAYATARAVAAAAGPDAGAVGAVAVWVATWAWAPGFVLFVAVLPLLLPDGRPPSPRWRPVVGAGLLVAAVATVSGALRTGRPRGLPRDNPLGVPALADLTEALSAATTVLAGLLAVAALVGLAVRFRAAGPVERRQLGWVVYALALAVVCTFVAPPAVVHVTTVLVPLAVAASVVRFRLYDIDVLVHRTLVGALLLGAAAAVHAGVSGWAAAALGGRGPVAPFVAAVAVALLFAPARTAAQRAVDRLLHGHRASPAVVFADLDARLRRARSPHDALGEVVDALARGLRLPGVEVFVEQPDGPVVTRRSGTVPVPGRCEVPLVWHGEQVGVLAVAPRRGEEQVSPLDRRVLGELAGRVAAVGYALRLTADVERSRERAVAAREEERRRLRGDLHDGLGPQLAGVVMLLDTAERSVRADGDRAGRLVRLARGHCEDAVADVRRLVHGLRPPVLDDLGLVGALRAATEGERGDGPQVHVAADDALGPLPAAVEVAAYRIAQEALANVARHAGATRAVLAVRRDGPALVVEVLDDGCGVPVAARSGVGLVSMRERAEELGGTCSVERREQGGTRVVARLPLPVAVPAQGSPAPAVRGPATSTGGAA